MAKSPSSSGKKTVAKVATEAVNALQGAAPELLSSKQWKMLKENAKRKVNEYHQNLKPPKYFLGIDEGHDILRVLCNLCKGFCVRKPYFSSDSLSNAKRKKIYSSLVQSFGPLRGKLVYQFRLELYEGEICRKGVDQKALFIATYPSLFRATISGGLKAIMLNLNAKRSGGRISNRLYHEAEVAMRRMRNCGGNWELSTPLCLNEIRLGYALLNAIGLVSTYSSYQLGLSWKKGCGDCTGPSVTPKGKGCSDPGSGNDA